MDALRFPRYRLVLVISTLSWVALWGCNIAAVAGMLQAGYPVGDIGLFQGIWTLGIPISVIVAGMLVDRLGATVVLVVGLAFEVAGLLAMANAFASGTPALTGLLVAAFLIGACDGFSGVSLNVLAGGVVPARHMPSAIGLLLLSVAAGRIVGGTAAGPFVAALGTAQSLLVCAGLVLAGMGLTAFLGRVRLAAVEVGAAYLDLRPGLRWFRGEPVATTTLVIGGLMALLVYGYFSMLPVVVGMVIGTDTGSQGMAMALGGVAVAVAALSIGSLSRRVGTGRLLIGAVLGSAVGLVGLAMGHTAAVVLLVVTLLPAMTNTQHASSSLLLQSLAPAAVRGRVLGLYSLVFGMLLPVGTIMAGWLGERFGVRETLVGLGVLMALATAALVARRPAILHLRVDAPPPVDETAGVIAMEPGAR